MANMTNESYFVADVQGLATPENTEMGAISNTRVSNMLNVLKNKVLGLLYPEPGFYKLPRDCL